MTEPPRRKHLDVLKEHFQLPGTRLLDVGCGDGSLVRALTREGARVAGLEINAEALAPARAERPEGDEDYVEGRGEALPFPAASFDAVIFFNSLHHVPATHHRAALAEAARVLRPGGAVWVVEPIAAGKYFELARPLEDETEIRAAAYDAIREAARGPDLRQERELRYRHPLQFKDFSVWAKRFIAVDPARRPLLERHYDELARRFEEFGERGPDGYHFDLEARANLLRRADPAGAGVA